MGRFLQTEKPHQSSFKLSSPYFSVAARLPGVYKEVAYPFCLPCEYAAENLFSEIRASALAFFEKHEIKWHDAHYGPPSNHLCSSQVCCVNFLYLFATRPEALAALLRPHFPTLKCMLPIEDGQHVTFEWIGLKNYLRERAPGGGIAADDQRTRGANYTSADAAVMFQHGDGRRQIVLIEWKYSESYGPRYLRFTKKDEQGTDRSRIYQHLWDTPNCPLNRQLPFSYYDLFYEPFYQLMRQQFLAWQMEEAHEAPIHNEPGADIVSVLHIAPRANHDFRRVTSSRLQALGDSPTEIWSRLVKTPGSFQSLATEDLFGQFPVSQFPSLAPWWEYLTQRYRWLQPAPRLGVQLHSEVQLTG